VTGRLVLWDFDGTLAFREGLWSGCVMEVLDAESPGHGVLLEDVRAGLSNGFPWHRPHERHPHPGNAERWWDAMEARIADALARAGIERGECAALARATHVRFVDPAVSWQRFEDAVPALTLTAQAGWTNVIVSNHVPELADLVTGLGLASHVDRVFTSALVGWEKPNARFFEHVLSSYGALEQAWMVGDNPVADVAGAEAVGLQAILVRTEAASAGHRARGLVEAAQMIVASRGRARRTHARRTGELT
jgi:putative hydrolase of the HAD superfamily